MRVVVGSVALMGILLAGSAFAKDAKPVVIPLALPREPIDDLLKKLVSIDFSVRADAAWQLAGAKEREAEIRTALQPLQSDAQRSVRYAAAWAFEHLGPTEYDTPPKPVHISRPTYPPKAFDAKVQGQVLVEILIGEEGEVAHVELRESIPMLDEAALACVAQWTFEPARIGGARRATIANAPVRFRRLK